MARFAPKKIIVHHSLTKDSTTVSWGAIRKYHTHTLMWRDIGYHAGIELVMSGQEAGNEILMGRMWDERGAHVRGQNHDSLGICFVGNYDVFPPPKEMLEMGAKLIALWMKLFVISIDDIYSHHHFNIHKSCPGKSFDMDRLKLLIQK